MAGLEHSAYPRWWIGLSSRRSIKYCNRSSSQPSPMAATAFVRREVHTILDGIGLRTSDLPLFTTRTAISISLGSSSGRPVRLACRDFICGISHKGSRASRRCSIKTKVLKTSIEHLRHALSTFRERWAVPMPIRPACLFCVNVCRAFSELYELRPKKCKTLQLETSTQ